MERQSCGEIKTTDLSQSLGSNMEFAYFQLRARPDVEAHCEARFTCTKHRAFQNA